MIQWNLYNLDVCYRQNLDYPLFPRYNLLCYEVIFIQIVSFVRNQGWGQIRMDFVFEVF